MSEHNRNSWRYNSNGNWELLPSTSSVTSIEVEDDESDNYVGPDAPQIRHPSMGDGTMGSAWEKNMEAQEIFHGQGGDKAEGKLTKVPAFVGYIPFPDGTEMKFSKMIFEAGKKLYTDKIILVNQGIPQEKVTTGMFVEALNTMWPVTIHYSPVKLADRITAYMKSARTKVTTIEQTGQGERGHRTINQEYSQEEEIIDLQRQADKVCVESLPAKVYYGAETRYTANSEKKTNVDSLEAKQSCFLCNETDKEIKKTEAGNMCRPCYERQFRGIDQGEGSGASTDSTDPIKNMGKIEKQDSRTIQNEALMNMRMPTTEPGFSGASEANKATRGSKRKQQYEGEDKDDKLTEMLMQRLQSMDEDQEMEKKKKKMEMEKLELEMEIMKRQLQNMSEK